MTTTEVGRMDVKPGLDIMDPSTPEGRILAGAWETVVKKPGGPYRVYWGLERDNPSKLWAFFDWDSVEQHRTFAVAYGADAVKDIPKICTHGEFSKHVGVVPSSDVLQSPVTEAMLVYFNAGLSQTDKEEAAAEMQRILARASDNCPGTTNLAQGWGVEDDFPVRGKQGQLGSVLMAFIGWSGHDVQKSVHDTAAYKEIKRAMQNIKGVVDSYSFSMTCQHLEREVSVFAASSRAM